ncbi:MAG TPA: secretin N-terminal domain-containing protein [Lacipirellulaceae bacterium]|jgi:type II secretory pathway component GspD/PulD (secretin)|nr:secretin N-terminal domain-containing protein [Lacipirellulaceae bacterium]
MSFSIHRQRSLCFVTAILLSVGIFSQPVRAQDVQVATPEGQPVQLSPEQLKAMRGRHGGPPPGMPPGATPGQPPPAAEGEKKKEGEEGDKKKEEAAATVKRPDKPPRVPDPREFDVKLDDKGRVPPFNFIGQPWPDVLQWLANISKCSLDWQELPNDYLNLTTQRPYALEEVRDLINRHLNARGYTAIQSGEVLSVFKIDKIDPSVVPRVTEEQLYDLKSYDFVKVSFDLPASMEVDKAKEDVKQIVSPGAKIFPLVASKRLLVMDTVANLRTVSELLNQERMVEDGRVVPKEFVLKYARPQQVIETLYVILGVDPKAKPAQTDPQMQAQQIQMMQQMQQQQGNKDAAKMMGKNSDAPKVHLAFNRQRNSVLANAPPDQMKIIEQAISYLDVPFGEQAESTDSKSTAGAASTARTMKKYPLTTLDPDKFVSTLEEIGDLSPYAEFKVDSGSKTLFALATADDHKKIGSLIDQFDGTGRRFEVIQLRRRAADAVAATISSMMGGQENQEEDKSKSRRYWSPWDDYGNRDDDKKKQVKGFGVDADVEHNQLLVWANDAELERVHDLLIKLGETPGGQRSSSPIRFVQPGDPKATAALLERLRAAWPSTGENPLVIKNAPPNPAPKDSKEKEKPGGTDSEPAAKPKDDRAANTTDRGRVAAQFVELRTTDSTAGGDQPGKQTSQDEPTTTETGAQGGQAQPTANASKDANDAKAKSKAPVTVTVTEDGKLMLNSTDTAALDRMEDLLEDLSPEEKRFQVFPLKYIRALEMWYDLNDYFKDDLQGDTDSSYDPYWWPPRKTTNKKGSQPGLSKRRKLMITYDRPSNTILVSNASASQLDDIASLIKEFDKPAPVDSVEIRQTAAIKVQYSKPSVIAAAVKEVYRDLLSSKDKEFDRGKQGGERSSAERMTVINYGGSGDSGSSGDRPSPMKVGFDGALSMGADDVSGVLIVSAQKGIFNDIVRMVHELDEQASPQTTVEVHRVSGNVSAEALQKAIDKAVGKAWLGNRPEQVTQQTGPPENGEQKNENDRGGRGEKRREKGSSKND